MAADLDVAVAADPPLWSCCSGRDPLDAGETAAAQRLDLKTYSFRDSWTGAHLGAIQSADADYLVCQCTKASATESVVRSIHERSKCFQCVFTQTF